MFSRVKKIKKFLDEVPGAGYPGKTLTGLFDISS